MTSEPPALRSGQSLGRYELLAPIAKGGMGQVWAGRLRGARGFQKLVAVKTLLPASEDNERMERMLFEEARIAGLIQHANVVQTMELGEHEGALYLVMEWVDGEPLSYLLKCCGPNGLPLLVAINLVAQTLHGLQAAHELCDESGGSLGVVHRDVSPHNVLVSYQGVAKLVDFGIAKAMNQESSSTSTGEIKGKFGYMAPEQILGGEVDQRADLFSVGIMLYLLTSGRHPFKNHDSAGVLHSISSDGRAPRPSLMVPGYSRALEAVVLKALEKNRDHRWASAAEMRAALQRAVPEAFTLGMDAELEAFMTRTVGERAAHKREALRRAELRSDRASSSSASLIALAGSPQSASSLPAVSVDTGDTPAEELAGAPSSTPTGTPAFTGVAAGSRGRRTWILLAGATAGLLLAFAVLRKPTQQHQEPSAASGGAPTPLPQQERHAPEAGLAAKAPDPLVVPSVTPSDLPIPPSIEKRTPTAPRRAPKPPANAHAKPAAPATAVQSDLIAPDYAR